VVEYVPADPWATAVRVYGERFRQEMIGWLAENDEGRMTNDETNAEAGSWKLEVGSTKGPDKPEGCRQEAEEIERAAGGSAAADAGAGWKPAVRGAAIPDAGWAALDAAAGMAGRALAAAVRRGNAEIARDIRDGIVPATVKSFGELHDYVDANAYGGALEWEAGGTELSICDFRLSIDDAGGGKDERRDANGENMKLEVRSWKLEEDSYAQEVRYVLDTCAFWNAVQTLLDGWIKSDRAIG